MKTVSLLAVIFLAFPAVLFSEGAIQSEFKAMDKDRDGFVSIIEAEGKLDLLRQWVGVDKNSDGQLEMSEFSAFEISPGYVQEDEEDSNIGAAPN